MGERVTIYTIAKDLGLSPGTISKVINNKGSVSQTTRQRVLKHIKEVGYVPSSSARMLKSKRTYTIGVIFSEDLNIGLEQSFFSSILQNFKNVAEEEGYELSFIVRKLGKNKLSYLEWCLNKRVDGVYIVVGDYNDPEIQEVIDSHIPCVSNDMIVPNLHAVISDNEQGIELILNYIQDELKLKRVGLISGPMRSKAFKERKKIYEEKVRNYNIKTTGTVVEKGFGFTSGYNATKKLIKDNIPEVILCLSDDLALGCLKALSDVGFDVPKDIQVIGFDDIAYAKHFTPSLTTIRQNRKELGERAAKDLIEHIESGVKYSKEVVRIGVELIRRDSTKEKV